MATSPPTTGMLEVALHLQNRSRSPADVPPSMALRHLHDVPPRWADSNRRAATSNHRPFHRGQLHNLTTSVLTSPPVSLFRPRSPSSPRPKAIVPVARDRSHHQHAQSLCITRHGWPAGDPHGTLGVTVGHRDKPVGF